MSDNQRELFGNNKITEALCQFSFKQHVNTDYYKKLSERLKERYSLVQEIPLIHFNFNFQNQNPEKLQSNGLRISNEKKDKIVQIFTDNISIHQVGNYQKWEVFRDDIYFVLDALSKDVSTEIGRIDLRAINVFEFDETFKPQEYFNLALIYPDKLVQNSNYHFQLEQLYEPGKKIGVVRGNYVKEKEKVKFIFDLSYVQLFLDSKISNTDGVELKKSLEEGHLALYNLFVKAITNKTREIIK